MVQSVMELNEKSLMKVMQSNDKGYVYIELLQPLEASKRGIMLLEFEFKPKEKLDQALTIWHSPQVSFEQGVQNMLEVIEHWRDAPVWDAPSIDRATNSWFKYLGSKP